MRMELEEISHKIRDAYLKAFVNVGKAENALWETWFELRNNLKKVDVVEVTDAWNKLKENAQKLISFLAEMSEDFAPFNTFYESEIAKPISKKKLKEVI